MTAVDGQLSLSDPAIIAVYAESVKHAAASSSHPAIVPGARLERWSDTAMYYELYYEVFQGWRWTLYAANHKKIANSGEGYTNKTDALNAIGLVKASGNAPVHDRTTA